MQKRIHEGEWWANSQSKHGWVGEAVAEVLDMDLDDPAQKAQVKDMLKAWIRDGALKSVGRIEKETGKNRPAVVVGEWHYQPAS